MTPSRLKYLEQFPNSCTERDIESLEALMLKFPFYSTPFVILAKVYHDQQNYKASEILKKASLRVFDRAELYNYIHSDNSSGTDLEIIVNGNETIPQEHDSDLPEDNHNNSNIERIDNIQPMEDASLSIEVLEIPEYPKVDSLTVEQESDNKIVFEKPDEQIEENEERVDTTDINKEINPENILEKAPFLSEIEATNKTEPEIHSESITNEIEKETKVNNDLVQSNIEQSSTDNSNTPVNFFDWISKIDSSEPEEIKTSLHILDTLGTEEIQLINTLPNNKSKGFSLPANEAIDLIDEFIRKSPQISRPKKEFFKAEKVAQKSLELSNEIVTETLAAIYAKQGHWEQAITAYQKLSLKFPQKQTYFAAIIEELKTKKEL